MLSKMNVVSKSQKSVVSNEKVSNVMVSNNKASECECGLKWTGLKWTWSQMNVSNDLDLALWHPVGFENFRAKITGSHVALHERNSGAESGRELFKGLKNSVRLVVYNEKKIFWLGSLDILW